MATGEGLSRVTAELIPVTTAIGHTGDVSPAATGSRAYLPPLALPLWYFAYAHAALLVALAVVAADPRGVSGFFYHPRMLGVVHLLTLGWITGSILGAIRIIAPLALRLTIPVTRGDYWAYGFVVIGTSGMVSHFWLESFDGMAWSAAMVVAGLAHPVARLAGRLRHIPVGGPVGLHLGLACLNLLLAGVLGVAVAIDKVTDVVPGTALSNVYAHAHLAAVGWASMMVVGVGYRLLPMVLPSAMPEGRHLVTSALLLEVGLLGLVTCLVTGWRGGAVFGLLVALGLAWFLSRVIWMATHRRRAPAGRARPDVAVWQAAHALLYLVLAAGCGLTLLTAGTRPWTPALMMAYGVFGLLGFLGQLVVAMELRLLPLLAWYAGFARRGGRPGPVSVHRLPAQPLALASFVTWVLGLPLLAAGLTLDAVSLVGAGAWILLVGVALNAAQAVWILRPAWEGIRRGPLSARR